MRRSRADRIVEINPNGQPRRRNIVGSLHLPRRWQAVLILSAAAWGMVVDGPWIGLLAPTGNSTIFQATTAAAFAVLGILFGPLSGALGGLIRDGSSAVVTLVLHPSVVTHPDFLQWIGRRAADIFEDVVLGWVPGLVGLRTRRTGTLVASAAVAAWLSLPFLVIANTLIAGHAGGVWTALTTRVGDWDEPVDPGLFVYALLTGAFTALCIAPATRRPRRTFGIGLGLAAAGLALIGLGAHY